MCALLILVLLLIPNLQAIDYDDLVPQSTTTLPQTDQSKSNSSDLRSSKFLASSEKLAATDLVIKIDRGSSIASKSKSEFENDTDDDNRRLYGGVGALGIKRSVVFQTGDQVEINLQLKDIEVDDSQKPKKILIEVGKKSLEKAVNSDRLSFSADQIIERQEDTSNDSYLAFKTTESRKDYLKIRGSYEAGE